MPGAHRDDDERVCSGTTIASGQSTVFVDNKLWAVEDDVSSHGDGKLISVTGSSVLVENKKPIVLGDEAEGDLLFHLPATTKPGEASETVFAYGA